MAQARVPDSGSGSQGSGKIPTGQVDFSLVQWLFAGLSDLKLPLSFQLSVIGK
jgi:hypothetical protein